MDIYRLLVALVFFVEFSSGYPYISHNHHSPHYRPYESFQDQNSLVSVNALDFNNFYLGQFSTQPQGTHPPTQYFHQTKFQTNPVYRWQYHNDVFNSMTLDDSPVPQNLENQFQSPNNCFTWTSPEGIQFKLNPMSRSMHFSDRTSGEFYNSNCGVEPNNYYSQPYYSPGSVSDFVNINI